MAIDKIKQIQSDIGGRFAYVECEDVEQLISFYKSNGFINFGKRQLDRDEISQTLSQNNRVARKQGN